jgi:hypothetical protein
MPFAPWLPPVHAYAPYAGDWRTFIQDLHGMFVAAFGPGIALAGKNVWYYTYIDPDWGYEEGFCHIITEVDHTKARNLDIPRAEKVPWCSAYINNYATAEVRLWRQRRDSKNRVVLWVPEDDYAVILEERGNSWRLVTAFANLTNHRCESFEREWETEQINKATL